MSDKAKHLNSIAADLMVLCDSLVLEAEYCERNGLMRKLKAEEIKNDALEIRYLLMLRIEELIENYEVS